MAVYTHCDASVVFMPKGWELCGRGLGRWGEVAGRAEHVGATNAWEGWGEDEDRRGR
jgi:hypothetical protein